MMKYEKYKDSGVDWIGEIPESWTIQRISWLLDMIGSGTTPKSDDDTLYSENGQSWLQTGDLTDGYINETSKRVSEKALKNTSLTVYPKGSLVVALYGATIGKLGILNIDCATNQACCVMNGSSKIDTKMAFYLLMASKPSLIAKSAGGGQPNISQDIISHHQLPVPTIGEQKAIVTYLDNKVSQIDKSVATINTEIDDLKAYRQSVISEAVTKGLNTDAKMKNSDVEWIGEIPESWSVSRIKHQCNVTDGTHFSPTTTDKGKPYVTVSNVKDNTIDIEGALLISEEDFQTLVKQGCQPKVGDILLSKDGTVGRSAIVSNNNEFVCLSSLGILSPSEKLCSLYLKYTLDSIMLQDQMTQAMAGSALRRITISKINEFFLLIPPLSEQQAIATYLDDKTSKIDNSIKVLEVQRDDLNALKQTIISEAVTGKIDVRNWKPNNA